MKRILSLIVTMVLLGSMALAEAEERPIATDESVQMSAFEVLQNGSQGKAVKTLQVKLRELGYNVGLVDGIFGPKTENGLKELQGAMGLEQTGIIDNQDMLDKILSFVKSDGVNILQGTNQGTTNYEILDKGFNATMEEDEMGVKVTIATQDDGGWLVLFFDDGDARNILSGSKGDVYTFSFLAKSNVESARIDVSFKQKDARENQIFFGTVDVGNEWKSYKLIGELTGTAATTQGLYLDLRHNNPETTFYIRDLKIEKGV